jgi:hypothetical protein
MEDNTKKSRRGLYVGLTAVAALGLFNLFGNTSTSPAATSLDQSQSAAVVNAMAPVGTAASVQAVSLPQVDVQPAPAQPDTNDLSNDRHYRACCRIGS